MGLRSEKRNRVILLILAVLFAVTGVVFIRTTASSFFALLKICIVFLVLAGAYMIAVKGKQNVLQWLKTHRKRTIRVMLLELCLLFYMLFYVYMIKGNSRSYFQAQLTVGILCMLVILIVFFLTESKKIPIHQIYVFLGIAMGIMFLMLQPVGTVPDEKVHLFVAYDLSNELLGIGRDKDGSLLMREDDAEADLEPVMEFGEEYNKLHEDYWESFHQEIRSEELVSKHVRPVDNQRYLYFISALGITIGRMLHLNSALVFLLGRILNLLFFVFITGYAIRCLPFGKMILVVLALMPMTLQQVSSYSSDVVIIALTFIFVALIMQLSYDAEIEIVHAFRRKKILKMAVLAVTCVLLMPVKGYVYAPLCFLILLPAVKTWKSKRKVTWFFVALLGICIALFVIKRILPFFIQSGVFSPDSHVGNADGGEAMYTLQYFLDHKAEWIYTTYNTSRVYGAFYLDSMIGTPLGWLTIPVNGIFIQAYVVFLFLAGLQRKSEQTLIGRRAKLGIHILSWGSVAAVLLAMLLACSPISARVIAGVQGRYFIPMCFPMLLTLRSNRIQADSAIDGPILIGVLTCLFFVVQYIIP